VNFSDRELRDLTTSALVLALAFAIMLQGGLQGVLQEQDAMYYLLRKFLMALIGISLGFVLHELGHRFVARKFDCIAEFEMWPTGLILALVMSMFGFVLAAPGAVMIRPKMVMGYYVRLSKERLGLISITGPAINLCLAIVFVILYLRYSGLDFWGDVFSIGALVNTWLACFNLIPLGPFDGKKIFDWDWRIWGVALAVAVALLLYVWAM